MFFFIRKHFTNALSIAYYLSVSICLYKAEFILFIVEKIAAWYGKYMKKFLPVAASIALAQMAGIIGSVFTFPSLDSWYVTLSKPAWTPPSWLFGPVWITLYTLMGIAAWLVWQRRQKESAKRGLIFYSIQLTLNMLWTIIFFGAKSIEIAFLEITILYVFIVLTIMNFWRVDKRAALLLLPYLAWVLFATVLNFALFELN